MLRSSSFIFIVLFCNGIFQETFAFHSRRRHVNVTPSQSKSPPNLNPPTNQDFDSDGPEKPQYVDNIRSSQSQSHRLERPKKVPLAVETFANHFISAIKASEGIFKAFKIRRFSPEEAGASLFDVVHSTAIDTGTRNPDFIAQLVEEAVMLNYHLVSDTSFLDMYGYGMGKFLLLMKTLNLENAHDLAQKYFEFVRNGIISEDGTPDGDIRGISDGFIGFVDSLGLVNSNTIPLLAVHFADEWYKLRS